MATPASSTARSPWPAASATVGLGVGQVGQESLIGVLPADGLGIATSSAARSVLPDGEIRQGEVVLEHRRLEIRLGSAQQGQRLGPVADRRLVVARAAIAAREVDEDDPAAPIVELGAQAACPLQVADRRLRRSTIGLRRGKGDQDLELEVRRDRQPCPDFGQHGRQQAARLVGVVLEMLA